MNNKYFLLRHGQTIYQTEKKDILYPFPENPPVGLTEVGKKQIEEAAEKIKDKGVNLIFSSDFFRTRQTAEIVAKKLGLEIYPVKSSKAGVPSKAEQFNRVNFDKRLRDLNMGVFYSAKKNDYLNLFSDLKERFSKRPENGENWEDVKKRLTDFLNEIEKKYQNKNILIISHGDPLWLLEGIIRDFKTDEEFLKIRIKDVYPDPGQLIETKG